MKNDMTNNPLSMDWQNLTRNELIDAGWAQIYDIASERSLWKHPNVPGDYGLNGAKYTQSRLQRR